MLYKHFTGRELTNAHRADADCAATWAVLQALMELHPSLPGASERGPGRACVRVRLSGHGCGRGGRKSALPRPALKDTLSLLRYLLPPARLLAAEGDFQTRLHALALHQGHMFTNKWFGWCVAADGRGREREGERGVRVAAPGSCALGCRLPDMPACNRTSPASHWQGR